MKLQFALFSLTLLNCAPPGDYKFHYELECASINSEFQLNVDTTSYKLQLAKNLFDAKMGPGEFCRLSSSVQYFIKDSCKFDDLAGYTNWDGTIQLEKRMSAINHELLHVLDGQRLDLGTSTHTGWNNYFTAYDGTSTTKYTIGWDFNNAIAPFPEAHPDGFDLDELATKTGTDGYECWEAQKD